MAVTIRKLGNNTLYSALSVILVILVFYYWLDIPISSWMTTHPLPCLISFSKACAIFFQPNYWIIASIIVGLIGLYLHFIKRSPTLAKPWLFFASAPLCTLIIVFVIKCILARYRPIELINHGLYGLHFFSLKYTFISMPSGHAAAAFAGFYALSRICNRAWVTTLLLILASIIALSRVIITAHFPSDVILGAYLGIITVIWLQHWMKYNQN